MGVESPKVRDFLNMAVKLCDPSIFVVLCPVHSSPKEVHMKTTLILWGS